MDVNETAVSESFNRHGVSEIIHGHTHRPAIHKYAETGRRRTVLGDWYNQGSVLRAGHNLFELGGT